MGELRCERAFTERHPSVEISSRAVRRLFHSPASPRKFESDLASFQEREGTVVGRVS